MSPTRAREDKDATLATPAPHYPVPNFRPRARNCLSAARGLSVPGPGTIFWYSLGVAIGVPLKTIHYSLFISEAPLRCSECSVFVLARA